MNNFLFYLERAWLSAAFASLIVSAYQLYMYKSFSNPGFYFPAICIFFCLLIYNNIRTQRLFKEKLEKEKNNP